MNKIKPGIKDNVAETLFIPLLSRAYESRRKDKHESVKRTKARFHSGLIMWLIPALYKSFGIVGYKVE